MTRVRAVAPGRVNLIGEHTDYTGGLVLPVAVDRRTTVEGDRVGLAVRLSSRDEAGEALLRLDLANPTGVAPLWARYVAGVVSVLRPAAGLSGEVRSTLPLGAGLASSAALEVAVALALGFEGTPVKLALACQSAEQAATGVPCGVMDQLASAAGVAGHALLIDCDTLDVTPVPLPDDLDLVVVHSGRRRTLGASPYAERRAQCEAAAALVGPLRDARLSDVEAIDDDVLRRRARHVVTENERVRVVAAALPVGDLATVGEAMAAGHASLRDHFEVSTPELDALVERLRGTPDVVGARLTGAGFGGCALALARPGAAVDGWRLRAVDGATVETFGT